MPLAFQYNSNIMKQEKLDFHSCFILSRIHPYAFQKGILQSDLAVQNLYHVKTRGKVIMDTNYNVANNENLHPIVPATSNLLLKLTSNHQLVSNKVAYRPSSEKVFDFNLFLNFLFEFFPFIFSLTNCTTTVCSSYQVLLQPQLSNLC